jgi:hypothetical protein
MEYKCHKGTKKNKKLSGMMFSLYLVLYTVS